MRKLSEQGVGANLAGSEGVRVESWQYEVLAGEIGHGDVLEVGVVHPRLARNEPGPIGSSRLNIYVYVHISDSSEGLGIKQDMVRLFTRPH